MMALAARSCGQNRTLHLFDSFEGLPEPTKIDGKTAADYSSGRDGGRLLSVGQCVAGLEEVKWFLLDEIKLDPSSVVFHQGWFQDTVPQAAPTLGPIALLRLDGDWFDSTLICLEHLYPLLQIGGIIVIDDYFAWEGCKKAVDQYRQQQGITNPMTRIDSDSVFWQK